MLKTHIKIINLIATDLYAGTWDDRAVLLAHSSSETTKIYTHPNLEIAKKWVDKMPVFGMD